MPKIEIIGPPMTGLPSVAWGTRVLMDGAEVPHVREVTLRAVPDEVLAVKMELLATESFYFAGEAQADITIVVYPGYELVQETKDGITRYRAVRIQ